jgi:hypothetical protein
MANTPTPRSYVDILSQMLATFKSRAKIKTLKIGNPILTILEAAAQSDVRSSQDLFNLLESISTDYADMAALSELIRSEGSDVFGARSASGVVTFTDTTISKLSTVLFQTFIPPGTTTIRVENASSFPATGSIYVGRGTTNYEGPLSYTSKADMGSYWNIVLASGTANPHNSGESIILSQGAGNRSIPVNTVVEVPATEPIKFTTTSSIILEDGEDTIEGVEVVCQVPGSIGNVAANSITRVSTQVFPGVAVTNPSTFTNGLEIETPEQLRNRLKKLRKSKTLGTKDALETYSLGVSYNNKTVVSSKAYDVNNKVSLYIDDGTGYEETFGGVSNEILVSSALGGEQFFALSKRPMASAFLESSYSSPFNLDGQPALAIEVNGITTEHQFSNTEFKNSFAASAYEVAAAINKNTALNFVCKVSQGKLFIFGKNSENAIRCVSPSITKNANDVLGFSGVKTATLRLFKNGVLLSQDGSKAVVGSNPQNAWGAIVAPADLLMEVDGVALSITINDIDFVNAQTGYTSVSELNSLESWRKVLKSKIPGVSVSVSGNSLYLESNLGESSDASIEILGGTLVTSGMFDEQSSIGHGSDFELNRNYSQVKLAIPLETGDSLVVSSVETRATTETQAISAPAVFASNFEVILFHNDLSVQAVSTLLTTATSITVTNPTAGISRYTATGAFSGLQIGDWIYAPQQTIASPLTLLRVTDVDVTGNWFETDYSSGVPSSGVFSRFFIARGSKNPERIEIPAGSYSLAALAAYINTNYPQYLATVTPNDTIKLSSKTYDNGAIYILGTTNDSVVVFESGVLELNNDKEVASVVSSGTQKAFPNMEVGVSQTDGTSSVTVQTLALNQKLIDLLKVTKKPDGASQKWGGPAQDGFFTINSFDNTTRAVSFETLNDLSRQITSGSVLHSYSPYIFSEKDTLSVTSNLNLFHEVPLYRAIKSNTATYGTAAFNVLTPDNQSLYNLFGTLSSDFFKDFAVLMRARGKSHSPGTNKTILFRNGSYGPHGESVRVAYKNPEAPNETMKLSYDKNTYGIHLASGAELFPATLLDNQLYATVENHLYEAVDVTRTGGNLVTVTLGPAGIVSHAIKNGDVIAQTVDDANFPIGLKLVTGVTANAFTYTEAGANVSATGITYVTTPREAGTNYTITAITGSATNLQMTFTTSTNHNFKVGDVVYFPTGHYESSITIVGGGYKVEAVTSNTVTVRDGSATTFTATLVGGIPYRLSEGWRFLRSYVFTNYTSMTGNTTRTGGIDVEVTFDYTAICQQHPFNIGDVVYITSVDANFPSGYKTVTATSNTSITYSEFGSNVSSASAITISLSPTLSPNFTGVVANNVLNKNSEARTLVTVSSGLLETYGDDVKDGIPYPITTASTALSQVNGQFQFYSRTTTNANTVVSWINTNAKDTLGNQLLTATLVSDNSGGSNNGTGNVDITEDEFFGSSNNASFDGSVSYRSVKAFPLFDGYQSVSSNNITVSNSQITFKSGDVSPELTSYSDFLNEPMILVPTTALNVVNLLNSTAYSGLSGSAVASVSNNDLVQISNKYAGSDYSVEVSGGLANTSMANSVSGGVLAIDGSARITGFSMLFNSSDVSGFSGGAWAKITNQTNLTKDITDVTGNVVITNYTGLKSKLVFPLNPVTSMSKSLSSTNKIRFENHGKISSLQDHSATPVSLVDVIDFIAPGGYIYVKLQNAGGNNTGLKRVVGFNKLTSTIYFEGTCVPETVIADTGDSLSFITYNSVVPGDTLTVTGNVLGGTNNGAYTVDSFVFNGSGAILNDSIILSREMTAGTYAVSNWKPNVTEENPISVYGQVNSINGNTDNSLKEVEFTFNNRLGFSTADAVGKLMNGASVEILNKLNFNTVVAVGVDGYKYHTGLLSEVSRVIFGDEYESILYKAVAAAGTNVSISAPFIKRVSLTIGIRGNQSNQNDLIAKVKNAVATVVNQSAVGESIALSDIIDAANSVYGVTSVVMISPQSTTSTDLITVQPYEKAKVLDADEDILVNILN